MENSIPVQIDQFPQPPSLSHLTSHPSFFFFFFPFLSFLAYALALSFCPACPSPHHANGQSDEYINTIPVKVNNAAMFFLLWCSCADENEINSFEIKKTLMHRVSSILEANSVLNISCLVSCLVSTSSKLISSHPF